MLMMLMMLIRCFFLFIALLPWTVYSAELRVAVAANFKSVLEQLSQQFMEKTSGTIYLSSASSGVLYNQIIHGAPFDVFLSADAERPIKLESRGIALKNSRRTYAIGQLVLWDKSGTIKKTADLKQWSGKFVIANPDTAPYGLAAKQTLEKLGLWRSYQPRVIQGSNIQQAWAFVDSGNAPLGMVAASQLTDQKDRRGIMVIVDELHDPIRQEMIILKRSKHLKLARQFTDFLLSPESQRWIAIHGYQQAESTS